MNDDATTSRSNHAARNHIENAERNKLVLLELLRQSGPLTRRELSERCALSVASVKRLADELLAQGLLAESEIDDAKRARGRRSSRLGLNGKFAFTIGFGIESHGVSMTAVDLAGMVVEERSLSGQRPEPPEFVAKAAAEVERLVEGYGRASNSRLIGVGVGVAGIVDTKQGLVHFCPNLPGWEEVELARELRRVVPAELIVDEAVRCMALAEKRYGNSRAHPTSLFAYIGDGVGAGIILDDRIYRGANGLAGEFGHITVVEGGPLCNCGNYGCLEAVASRDALLRSAEEFLASNVYTSLRATRARRGALRLADIAAAAADGDKLASRLVNDAGEHVGTALAGLLNLLDPGVVIVGGEVISTFGGSVVDQIARTVRLRAIHSVTKRTVILGSVFDRNTTSLGAAALPTEAFLGTHILNVR